MKRVLCLLSLLLLAGCAVGPPIDETYTAKAQGDRIRYLVLHYTALDWPTSLRVLTEQIVSSHYLVRDDPPIIYRLVDESRRANHAGVSSWQGQTSLNDASIGIEIVNLGYEGSPENRRWPEYKPAQIDAVVALVKDIVKRHGIRPDRVVGHSDIAPQRKTDPGPQFPWKRLADEGLVQWPDADKVAQRLIVHQASLPDVAWWQFMLDRHGFAVPRTGELDEATVNVIAAFQMKYRNTKFDGMPDAETAAILDALVNP